MGLEMVLPLLPTFVKASSLLASTATTLVAEPAERSLAIAMPPPFSLLLPSTPPPFRNLKIGDEKEIAKLKTLQNLSLITLLFLFGSESLFMSKFGMTI